MKKIIPILLLLVIVFSCKENTSNTKESPKAQTPVKLSEKDPRWYYGEKFSVSPMLENGTFILTLEYNKGKVFKDTVVIYYKDINATADLYKEIRNHKPADFILTTDSSGVINITTNRVMKNHYWYNDSMHHFIYLTNGPVKNYDPD